MFGIIPKPLWSHLTDSDDENRILLQTNCLLLESETGEKIIIETGYGDKMAAKDRQIFDMQDRCLTDALAEIDVDPAEISAVVLTHLHFDHAGGATRLGKNDESIPTFPNAKVYAQQTEWDDALANKSTMTKTYLRENFEPLADRMVLLDGECEPLPGIQVGPMPGHTWGQQMIRFRDEQGVVAFAGDVMPTAAHVGLAYNMAYDVLPYTNIQSKRGYLQQACEEGWRVIPPHEPGEPIRRVEKHAKREGAFSLSIAASVV